MSRTKKITFSAIIIAIYIILMYLTQSFAFGQIQVRIATALYALAAPFPFLILPLALANGFSNLLLNNPIDAICGFAIGLITSYVIYLIRQSELPDYLIFLPICFIIGLGVPIWLSIMLHIPYWLLALNLLIGQAICGVIGVILLKAVKKFEK